MVREKVLRVVPERTPLSRCSWWKKRGKKERLDQSVSFVWGRFLGGKQKPLPNKRKNENANNEEDDEKGSRVCKGIILGGFQDRNKVQIVNKRRAKLCKEGRSCRGLAKSV